MGPFQNKGDFRKSKDAVGLEISVRNWITFGHMAPASSEKVLFFDIFDVEFEIAVYTCRSCFCAKSAPPGPPFNVEKGAPPGPPFNVEKCCRVPAAPPASAPKLSELNIDRGSGGE